MRPERQNDAARSISQKSIRTLAVVLIVSCLLITAFPFSTLLEEAFTDWNGRNPGEPANTLNTEVGGNQWDFVQNNVYKKVLVEVHTFPSYSAPGLSDGLAMLNGTFTSVLGKTLSGLTIKEDIPSSLMRETYGSGSTQAISSEIEKTRKHGDTVVLTILLLNGGPDVGTYSGINVDASTIALFPDKITPQYFGALLLHEFGHVMGLVIVHGADSPYTPEHAKTHADPASPQHCRNLTCVMSSGSYFSTTYCSDCLIDLAEIRAQTPPYSQSSAYIDYDNGLIFAQLAIPVSGIAIGAALILRSQSGSSRGRPSGASKKVKPSILKVARGFSSLPVLTFFVAAMVLIGSMAAVGIGAQISVSGYRIETTSIHLNDSFPFVSQYAQNPITIGGKPYAPIYLNGWMKLVPFNEKNRSLGPIPPASFSLPGSGPLFVKDSKVRSISLPSTNPPSPIVVYSSSPASPQETSVTVPAPENLTWTYAVDDGRYFYTIRGWSMNQTSNQFTISGSIFRIDPGTGTAVSVAVIPFDITQMNEWNCAFLDGSLYIFMRLIPTDQVFPERVNRTVRWDSATDTWTSKSVDNIDAVISPTMSKIGDKWLTVNIPRSYYSPSLGGTVIERNVSAYWFDPKGLGISPVEGSPILQDVYPVCGVPGGLLLYNGSSNNFTVLSVTPLNGPSAVSFPGALAILFGVLAVNSYAVRRRLK
ncbi:MAG TPA: hypothetical protein VEH08_04335 [Methanomassiliicoccales archaeon]|nr:hypothetical protein [Methanomassiliicoccales archaeon]